ALKWQPGGIQNSGADLSDSGGGLSQLNVFTAGAVASFAIDSPRLLRRKHRIGSGRLPDRVAGVRIMAEHAGAIHGAAKIGMVRPIVTWSHAPRRIFGIPGKRQLHEPAVGRALYQTPGVIARSEHVVDLNFDDIRLLAVETDLMPAQVNRSIPA